MDIKVTVKYAKIMFLKCYHVARNVDSGKYWQIWRIDLWFAELFPANVSQICKIDLIWSSLFNAGFIQRWLRVVPVFQSILAQMGSHRPGLATQTSTQTLLDPDGLLSERVSAKATKLANAEVKQSEEP